MNDKYLSAAVDEIALSMIASNAAPGANAIADRWLRLVFLRANDDTYELTRHRKPHLQNRRRIDHPASVANENLNVISEVERGV